MTFQELKAKNPLIVIQTPKLLEMKRELLQKLGQIEVELEEREEATRWLKRARAEINAEIKAALN